MPVVATHLTSGVENTDGTEFTTASISPTGNSLILLAFSVRNGSSTDPTIASVAGNGLTWVLVDSSAWDPDSTSRRKLFVYRAMGASPSTGAITITTDQTETDVSWSVDEFSNVVTTGANGADAVVQSVDNNDDGVTELTVTLSAFADSDNATYGAFSQYNSQSTSEEAGYTQLSDVNTDGGNSTSTQFLNSADTSVYASWADSTKCGGIGIEIAVTAGSSASPSFSPSVSPSFSPSVSPSASPSQSPSASISPSASPSQSPSASISPSASPSAGGSSASPSLSPSLSPSASPSLSPSASPSLSPSISPSVSPSASPSVAPSYKDFRVMRIQGEFVNGVFTQNLYLREITAAEDDA